MVLSAYLRFLRFLLVILIPACASSSLVFLMMYSAYLQSVKHSSLARISSANPENNVYGYWSNKVSYTPGFEIISCQLCELESNVVSLPSCCCFSEMGHYQYLTYRIFVHVLLLSEVSWPLKGEAATFINVMIPTILLPFTMCVTLIKFSFCILISLSINWIKWPFCSFHWYIKESQ